MTATNISRAEAQQRSALVGVESYAIALDLSEVERSATFGSRTHVRFTCAQPGDSTWIDLIADEIESVVLNGRALHFPRYDGARLHLPGLAAHNELVVVARCRYMTTGEGLHRLHDPADGATYVYTQFATAEARRVFACFEQPDLKARFTWDVIAPGHWVVASNTPAAAPGPVGPGLIRWEFPATPPLSTYLAALCAGPFEVVRSEYAGPHGTYPLALLVRRSMAEHLDAEEFLAITRAGLAHFEAEFALPYPFGKYDQVLLPEYNLGAMENPGLVTFREEAAVFRSRVPDAARERRAVVILHEMAHMWFGDLVTMRWWDDLWLNESFATWAGYRVASLVTRHDTALTSFALSQKAWAYRQDELPSTHPIVADMVDLEAVYLNFDGITYAKGASVLTQLVAFVGIEPFLRGLNAYFAAHAWGSATRADLIGQLSSACGRDLAEWERVWLELPGVTTLQPRVECDPDGRYQRVVVEQHPARWPAGIDPTLRPHRVAVGLYRWADLPQGPRLVRSERVEVEVLGAETEVLGLRGLPAADLVLVNDDDLTYAKVGFDPGSSACARAAVSAIAEPLPRALVWGALWEQVRDAALPAQEFLGIAASALSSESHPAILESLDQWMGIALDRFLAPDLRPLVALELSEATRAALDGAEPGSDRQLSLARAHVARARGDDHVDALRDLLSGRGALPGLLIDDDLRWRIIVRLAALGACDERLVDEAQSRDRTTSGAVAAARARAVIPTESAKRRAWQRAFSGRLSTAELAATVHGFGDPEAPSSLLGLFGSEYFAQIAQAYADRSPAEAQLLARGLFPPIDTATVAGARALLAEEGVPAGLHRVLAESCDEAERALRCRALSGRSGRPADERE